MAYLGVLFALDEEQAAALRAVERPERPDYIRNDLEDVFWYDRKDDMAELDRSWDAMHRVLTDGRLLFGDTCAPLSGMLLGGEVLYGDKADEDDYIITWKAPEQVKEIAAAAEAISAAEFHEKYFALNPEEYGMAPYQEDYEYTWAYFRRSLRFWQRAAENGSSVIFTADL